MASKEIMFYYFKILQELVFVLLQLHSQMKLYFIIFQNGTKSINTFHKIVY